MNERLKVDEAILKAVWASTFGAIAAREIGKQGVGRMEAVKRARDGADEAVRLLRALESAIISDEQDAFKEGDYLTTQYGMLFEIELVFRDLPANPTRVTSMLLQCGEERPVLHKRVSEIGWKGGRSWPDGLEPYVFRLTDRRPGD